MDADSIQSGFDEVSSQPSTVAFSDEANVWTGTDSINSDGSVDEFVATWSCHSIECLLDPDPADGGVEEAQQVALTFLPNDSS